MTLKELSSLIAAVSLCLSIPAVQAAGGWQEKLNKSGIVLSQRAVPGKAYQQIQGQMVISGRIDPLVGILNNPGLCSQWLNNCLSSKIVEQVNPAERINYTVVDAPLLYEDRDMYIRSKASYDSQAKAATITLQGIENYAAAQGKRVRVKSLNGFWRFQQLNEHQVRVSYQMYSDPQITPASAVDSFSPESLFKTFSNLRRLATSPAHQNIRFKPAELQAITRR